MSDDEFDNLDLPFTTDELASIDHLVQAELSSSTQKRKRDFQSTSSSTISLPLISNHESSSSNALPPHDDSPVMGINRAPVLCLWVSVCVEKQLGVDWKTAVTFGKAVMAKFAEKKAVSIGIRKREEEEVDVKWKEYENRRRGIEMVECYNTVVEVMRKPVVLASAESKSRKRAKKNSYVINNESTSELTTSPPMRACVDGHPVDPNGAERYMKSKFGERYDDALRVMKSLVDAIPLDDRFGAIAQRFYGRFRPEVDDGIQGWGKGGVLDLDRIASLRAEI
ncbi:hypothetical protein HDU67_008733 [Dinochytrium kinnereticum]|nr:hypothetical protein HDU67_008733 [Dinochytrium kinnereticum]